MKNSDEINLVGPRRYKSGTDRSFREGRRMLLSLWKDFWPEKFLPLDLVYLGVESFHSVQAWELRLYVHLADVVMFHRGLLLWAGENVTGPPWSLLSFNGHYTKST